MQNREKSIEVLNKAISMEMQSLNQYMYYHIYCADRGYDALAGLFKKNAITEMIHCEKFAERVLFLGGAPNMNITLKLNYTTSIEEMFSVSMELENDAITKYNHWAMICGQAEDSASKRLFEKIIEQEESHYDSYDIIHSDVENFGQGYLALQSMEHSRHSASNETKEE